LYRIVPYVPTRNPADPPADDDPATPAIGADDVDDASPPSTGAGRSELPAATLKRFRERDSTALAEVYDRYHRATWSVAMSITRADHLAQEAVQDTFVRAWQAAGQYDPSRDLGPWLMTIARHATLDLVRREMRPTRGGHEAEQDAVVEDPGIDPVWTAWQVQEALRRLTDDEALIIRLAFFEDLTQTQIATRLDVPVGTVKSRSHRAHRRLAELLAHLREEPAAPVNRSGSQARIPSGLSGEGSEQR
jgi:RNA polymerase sigma-70 factor (ECF subfamily)